MKDQQLTYKLETRGDFYCLVFSDGVVLKKEKRYVGKINRFARRPMVLTNYRRPDQRWVSYTLWSNGKVEPFELKQCPCLLPKSQNGLSPVDYEMYVLLFQNWVKRGKLEYLSEDVSLERVLQQFSGERNSWLGDSMHHEFKCKECKDTLALSLDTYRGGGRGFYRKEREE